MKHFISKLLIGAILIQVVLACISVLTGDFNTLGASGAMSSISVLISGAIPCFLLSRIVEDEQYGFIGMIGIVLTIITTVLNELLAWGLAMFASIGLTKILIISNILVWSLTLLAVALAVNAAEFALSLFKSISIVLDILVTIYLCFEILSFDILKFNTPKILIVLIIVMIGSYSSMIILDIINRDDQSNGGINFTFSNTLQSPVGSTNIPPNLPIGSPVPEPSVSEGMPNIAPENGAAGIGSMINNNQTPSPSPVNSEDNNQIGLANAINNNMNNQNDNTGDPNAVNMSQTPSNNGNFQ